MGPDSGFVTVWGDQMTGEDVLDLVTLNMTHYPKWYADPARYYGSSEGHGTIVTTVTGTPFGLWDSYPWDSIEDCLRGKGPK